jgi:antibiotic biosynthesis monooxygenase (ABM) superfamily enzyme
VEVRGRQADDRSKEIVIRFETKDHITLWMSQLERISQLINVPTSLA